MAKKKAASKNAVATQAEAQLPAEVGEVDLAAFAGAGQVEDKRFLAIPYLAILGLQSAACVKQSQKYVEGAEAGDFIETLNKTIFKGQEGVVVVPVLCKVVISLIDGTKTDTRYRLAKWSQKDGLEEIAREGARLVGYKYMIDPADEHSNYFEEELEFYVMIKHDENTWKQACMSLTGTKIKTGREWNSMAAEEQIDGGRQAPIFACEYRLKSFLKEGDGNQWFNFTVEKLGRVANQQVLKSAINFFQVVDAGQTRTVGEEEHQSAPTPVDI